jgi:hypothetical protein
MVQSFFGDLSTCLFRVENLAFGEEELTACAPICRNLSILAQVNFLQPLYALDNHAVGNFLVLCMRVNNFATHLPADLTLFGNLFHALGIQIVGPWQRCVAAANFASTTYAGNTLTVTI